MKLAQTQHGIDAVPVYGSGGFTSYSIESLQKQLSGWHSSRRAKSLFGNKGIVPVDKSLLRLRWFLSDAEVIHNESCSCKKSGMSHSVVLCPCVDNSTHINFSGIHIHGN